MDVAAVCEVLFRITGASTLTTLEAGKPGWLGTQEMGNMVRLTNHVINTQTHLHKEFAQPDKARKTGHDQ